MVLTVRNDAVGITMCVCNLIVALLVMYRYVLHYIACMSWYPGSSHLQSARKCIYWVHDHFVSQPPHETLFCLITHIPSFYVCRGKLRKCNAVNWHLSCLACKNHLYKWAAENEADSSFNVMKFVNHITVDNDKTVW